MADIATKLTDLQTDLQKCRTALTNLGAEINATAGFAEVADKLENLSPFLSIGTVKDDNVSSLKLVPINSVKTCYLRSLGGMTYRDTANNTLIDNKPTAIKVHGSNIINLDVVLNAMGIGYTKNGDSYTLGSNLILGFRNPRKFTDYPQVCTISIESSSYTGYTSPRLYLGYMDDNGTFTSRGSLSFGSNTTTVTSTGVVNAIRTDFSGTSGTLLSVTFSKLRINYGTVDCGYEPYHAPETISIPESLQGTGKGIDKTYHDSIDLSIGEKSLELGTTVFNGTENWALTGSQVFYATLPVNTIANSPGICSHYPVIVGNLTSTSSAVAISSTWLSSATNRVYFGVYNSFTSVADWKAYLQEQYAAGTPVTVTYVLGNDTESSIDISAFDNLIEVQAGGSIEIVTDNGKAVPTTIMYQTLL